MNDSDDTQCPLGWLPPESAPMDGTPILGDFGWPWPNYAVWDPMDEEWCIANVQASHMGEEPVNYWIEADTEGRKDLRRWRAMPALPNSVTGGQTTKAPDFARFGESLWRFITEKGGAFCGEEISEEILPLAQAAGLLCRVNYDPAAHGEGINADPGDEIWWWTEKEGGRS